MRHPVAGEGMTVNHPCLVIVPSLWRHKLARGCQQSVPIIQCSVDVDPSKGREGCWFTFSVPGWQSGTCRYKSGTQSYTKVHSRYTKSRTGTQRYTPGRFTGKQKLWRTANLIYYNTQWYIRERFGEPVNAVPAQYVCKMGEKYAQRVQNVHKIGAK